MQQIAGKCNRIVNEAIPITDARLENGDRVNIVLPPVAVNGPIITIRRFPKEPITMERLIELGSVSKEVADFLKQLVCVGYNIFICGRNPHGLSRNFGADCFCICYNFFAFLLLVFVLK